MNNKMSKFSITIIVAALGCLLLVPLPGHSQSARDGLHLVESPNFNTDLGIHLSFGGHSCIGGGSGYADCNDVRHSWDTFIGLQGGIMVRPFANYSFGIDAGYVRMLHHQHTDDYWSDFTIGPIVRGHLPLRLQRVLIEPTLGFQLGYVNGTFFQAARTEDFDDYRHRHLGIFFALALGVDIFIPGTSFGVGLETRLLRTVYREVCFEWSEGTNCRGIADDSKVNTTLFEYDEELEIEVLTGSSKFPGEKGIATYPWKLYYGAHIIYYF